MEKGEGDYQRFWGMISIRFMSIYIAFMKQELKSLVEYRADFLLGVFALVIENLASFIVLFAVFTQIDEIVGFSFYEILLFYGYSIFLRGIDHMYNDNIWAVAWHHIREGSFYRYLIRPINPLMHVVMEKFKFDGFGEVLLGLFIFLFAKTKLNLEFSLTDWMTLFVFMVSGLLIYFSIKLMYASFAFWTISSGEIITLVYELNQFTRYPLDIYRSKFIKFVLLFLIPFAVVDFLPMLYFIREDWSNSIAIADPVIFVGFIISVSILLFCASLFIWRLGMKKYEGAGT